jgi:hypothetical protein
MHTHSSAPSGSIDRMNRMGRPPPAAAYARAFRPSRKGATPGGRRMSTTYASDLYGTSRPFARPGFRPSAARVRQYATPPRDRTRKITSSRRRAEVVQNCIRHVRPSCTTGPPSVSSRPWRTAKRTSGVLNRYTGGTNFVLERVPQRPRARDATVTGFGILSPPRPTPRWRRT